MDFARSVRNDLQLLGLLLAIATALTVAVAVLFAYPLLSAAIGVALPIMTGAAMTYLAFVTNLRWSLWHGKRPFFFGIADLGFVLCMASFLTYGVADFIASWDALIYLTFGLVFLGICRVLFIEYEAWILGLIFSVVMLAVFGAYIRDVIVHPEWFFDFMTALLLSTGLALVLAGSAASYFESRRGKTRLAAPPGGRWIMPSIAICLAVLAIASGIETLSDKKDVSPGETAGLPSIAADGGEFVVTWWLPAPRDKTLLYLKNDELLAHNVSIESLGVDVTLGPGSGILVDVGPTVAGEDYRIEDRLPGKTRARQSIHAAP